MNIQSIMRIIFVITTLIAVAVTNVSNVTIAIILTVALFMSFAVYLTINVKNKLYKYKEGLTGLAVLVFVIIAAMIRLLK